MARRASLLFLLVVIGLMPHAAGAQELPTIARRYRLDRVCAPELARFCPALVDQTTQPRNLVICLRPYRTSLSLSCRHAVNAALNPTPAR